LGLLPDSDLVNAYHRDGAVVIRGLFDSDQISMLESGIEQNLHNPSTRAKVASRPEDPGRFFEDFCNWQKIDAYERLIKESAVGAIGAALMQSRSCRLYHDHLLVKEPGTHQPTPWHQDQPYYNIEGQQNVSMWIPVDPVPRETTLEFIAGSHLGPWLMPRTFMDNQAKWFPSGSLQELPDVDAQREKFKILGWALEPGDAVCFHMLTLHASPGVGGDKRRRAFSVRLLGDDITHAPRRWTTSPDFPGLENEIAAGVTMNHPLFPLLAGTPNS
jgi:ectoine hydroxylase-related dioxygenase (phytanoyl-CoA dioxygenase family)